MVRKRGSNKAILRAMRNDAVEKRLHDSWQFAKKKISLTPSPRNKRKDRRMKKKIQKKTKKKIKEKY